MMFFIQCHKINCVKSLVVWERRGLGGLRTEAANFKTCDLQGNLKRRQTPLRHRDILAQLSSVDCLCLNKPERIVCLFVPSQTTSPFPPINDCT